MELVALLALVTVLGLRWVLAEQVLMVVLCLRRLLMMLMVFPGQVALSIALKLSPVALSVTDDFRLDLRPILSA